MPQRIKCVRCAKTNRHSTTNVLKERKLRNATGSIVNIIPGINKPVFDHCRRCYKEVYGSSRPITGRNKVHNTIRKVKSAPAPKQTKGKGRGKQGMGQGAEA